MNFDQQIRRYQILDEKIRSKQTGSPKQLAKDLNISVSQLYFVLNNMKRMGAGMKYSKNIQSYTYTRQKKFVFGFFDLNKADRILRNKNQG